MGRFHKGRRCSWCREGSRRIVSHAAIHRYSSADWLVSSLIKSGTDFRDLSEAILQLKDQPEGSIRRRTITGLTGKA